MKQIKRYKLQDYEVLKKKRWNKGAWGGIRQIYDVSPLPLLNLIIGINKQILRVVLIDINLCYAHISNRGEDVQISAFLGGDKN